MQRIELTVGTSENKSRLEDFLCGRFGALSKMYLREVVKTGGCEVNGRNENIGHRLQPNDFIEIKVDLGREHSMLPQKIQLEIVFEDPDLIVVNKAHGMLVHPSHRDKNDTLLNALAYHFNPDNRGPVIRPGLVHRLDKETSGLIVVAKNARAHRILSSQFYKKSVSKRYLALVDGIVKDDEGTILGAIGRFPDQKMWGLSEEGRDAETRFWVRERFGERTLIELEPVTGRTNQLRIHCEAIGHPIVGDTKRGGSEKGRLCLHAFRLGFRHPANGKEMAFNSGMPDWSRS